jgi:uncharacterized protein (DUF1778 family)
MTLARKSAQLQIRVSPQEKAAIRRAAQRIGQDVSSFVLSRVLPARERRWQELLRSLERRGLNSHALAELNDLLSDLEPWELPRAVSVPPSGASTLEVRNYVAAMVEQACSRLGAAPPAWTGAIPPLEKPFFGSDLQSLRLHLLSASPPPFRRRNIFIDTSIGGRV